MILNLLPRSYQAIADGPDEFFNSLLSSAKSQRVDPETPFGEFAVSAGLRRAMTRAKLEVDFDANAAELSATAFDSLSRSFEAGETQRVKDFLDDFSSGVRSVDESDWVDSQAFDTFDLSATPVEQFASLLLAASNHQDPNVKLSIILPILQDMLDASLNIEAGIQQALQAINELDVEPPTFGYLVLVAELQRKANLDSTATLKKALNYLDSFGFHEEVAFSAARQQVLRMLVVAGDSETAIEYARAPGRAGVLPLVLSAVAKQALVNNQTEN